MVTVFWSEGQLQLLSSADAWDTQHCCECCQQAGWSWYQFWISTLSDAEAIPFHNIQVPPLLK